MKRGFCLLVAWGLGMGQLRPANAAPVAGVAAVAEAPPVTDVGSRGGLVGLPRMSTADAGAPAHLRLGLSGEFFRDTNFLVSAPGSSGDRHTRLRGTLSVAGTPLPGLELFGALAAASNRNRRICSAGPTEACNSESGRSDPEVIRTSAALTLGGKLARRLHERWALGGETAVRFLPSVDGLAFDPGSTSGYANLLASAELLRQVVPLSAHLSAGFYLDNSPDLRDDSRAPLSSRLVSAFAYGVARSRAQFALGFASPWREPWSGRLVRPSAEYHLDVVTAKGDPTFAEAAALQDRRNRDQHWLSLGIDGEARRGLTVGLSVDLALRSVGFRHGTRLPPWNVVLGLSQSLDLGAPRVVTQVVERVVAPPPREGFVAGRVVDEAGAPVDGALVAIEGRPRTRVASDPDGSFRTTGFAPGPVALVVSAPRFERVVVPAVVRAGTETPLVVKLTLQPHPVIGRLVDVAGNPVAGTIRVSGPRTLELTPDAVGAFSAQLPAGRYELAAAVDGHLVKRHVFEVADVGESRVEVAVRPRPAKPRVTLEETGVVKFTRPLAFVGAPASGPAGRTEPSDLAPETVALLDELVDALLQRPDDRRRLRIEAFWDRSLPTERAQTLTDRQAGAVVAYLERQGLARERLEGAGMGNTPGTEGGKPRRRLDLRLVD